MNFTSSHILASNERWIWRKIVLVLLEFSCGFKQYCTSKRNKIKQKELNEYRNYQGYDGLQGLSKTNCISAESCQLCKNCDPY